MKLTHHIFGLLALFLLLGGCTSIQSGGSPSNVESVYYDSDGPMMAKQGGMMPSDSSGVYVTQDMPMREAAPSIVPAVDEGTYQTKEGTVRVKVDSGTLESSLVRAKSILSSKGAQTTSVYYNEYYGTQTYVLTFKIVPDSFDSMLQELSVLGDVTDLNVQVQDVTREYVDLDIRLKNKKVELERLYVLFNQTEDVEGLLAVEKEISRVTSDLEILTSQKQSLEGRISKSTVVLELYSYVGVPESQEAQVSLKVKEGTIEEKLQSLKGIVSSKNGKITSLQFSDNTYEKHYEILLSVPFSSLEGTLESLRTLGEVKQLTTNINAENRPKESIISVRLVEEKPEVQRSFFLPLDSLGELFFGAFSIGIMAIVGLLGLLIPLGVIVVIAKKAYSFIRKKDTNVPSTQEKPRK